MGWCAIVSLLLWRGPWSEIHAWADSPAHGLGLVLLLDQFSRQVWRDEAKAFAGDQQAQALSKEPLQLGWVQSEPERAKRQFWLMPLLHSEENKVVAQAIPLLEHWVDSSTAAYLIQLQCFGRYPHRNAALGRVSSSDEVLFLQH